MQILMCVLSISGKHNGGRKHYFAISLRSFGKFTGLRSREKVCKVLNNIVRSFNIG